MNRQMAGLGLACAAVGAVVGCAVVVWVVRGPVAEAADPPGYAKVLSVQALRLVDEQGRPRGGLATVDGLTTLQLLRPDGTPGLECQLGKAGAPGIVLRDAKGMMRWSVGVIDRGPLMVFCDAQARLRMEIGAVAEGAVAVRQFGANAKRPVAILAATEGGEAGLIFVGPDGRTRWSAP